MSVVEDDVRAVVIATLAEWDAGDAASFAKHFHPDFTEFPATGGLLEEGDFAVRADVVKARKEAGLTADLHFRHLDVRVYGDVAIATGYMTGTIQGSGGVGTPGCWRYSDVWVKQDGQWRAIHAHFSPLTPPQG